MTLSDTDSGACAICFESLAAAPELARPCSCQHRFCRACLERLCRENPCAARCPLDRMQFSQYGVSKRGTSGEVVHDAETLQPLPRMFGSQNEPLLLGCALLVALWAAPSWTLTLHIVAVCGIFVYSEGLSDWKFYIVYACAFYGVLLPLQHFGLTVLLYAWLSAFLLVRWTGQLPELRSNEMTPEKLLFGSTVVLLLVVSPAVLFSLYTLLQVYVYVVGGMLGLALETTLHALHGNRYASYSLVFFCALHAPYLCQLSELSLTHISYTCSVLVYLLAWYTPDNVQVRARLPEPNFVAKFICCLALPLLLQFSLWNAVYSAVCVAYYKFLIGFLATERGKLLLQRVPLLLVSNMALNLLLPWKLFGLGSCICCAFTLICTNELIERVTRPLGEAPAGHLTMIIFQFSVLGILVPALLF